MAIPFCILFLENKIRILHILYGKQDKFSSNNQEFCKDKIRIDIHLIMQK